MEQLLYLILTCVKEGTASVDKALKDIMELFGKAEDIAKLDGIIQQLDNQEKELKKYGI